MGLATTIASLLEVVIRRAPSQLSSTQRKGETGWAYVPLCALSSFFGHKKNERSDTLVETSWAGDGCALGSFGHPKQTKGYVLLLVLG